MHLLGRNLKRHLKMLEHIKLKMEQNQPIRYIHKYNSVERILYKLQI